MAEMSGVVDGPEPVANQEPAPDTGLEQHAEATELPVVSIDLTFSSNP